jgi:Zn-finger nucleic acid-binding protein
MNCPVCSEKMKTIERQGVEIEICPGCKGIWLDSGELEKLLALDDGDDAAQDADATAIPAEAPTEPAPAKDAKHASVFDPVPDEMPAEYKHQERGRFRDAAKGAAGHSGAYKPAGGRIPGQRGGGGRASSVASILKSIHTGG